MLQTLFHIPLWPFQSPWLWIWLGLMGVGALLHGKQKGWSDALSAWGPPMLMLWLFPTFLMGQLVDYGIDPDNSAQVVPLGIAVRGYGVMMLLGIVAGVLLAIHRCHPEQISAEQIFSLSLHLIVFGIVGARIFYVIQYWPAYAAEPFPQRLVSMVNMTKGGLVVLGSFVGASLGMAYWAWRQKIKLGKLADLVAPSFLVGLSLGRIGCLFNGCCFGGYCEIPNLAVQFPVGSPPYIHQIEDAWLLGVKTTAATEADLVEYPDLRFEGEASRWRIVKSVPSGSAGEQLGLEIGEVILLEPKRISDPKVGFEKALRAGTAGAKLPEPIVIYRLGKARIDVPWELLPDKAQPIHPTQIYSSINALLLAVIVAFSYRYRRFDGQSFALMLILYGITRFVIEWIRQDEAGQFGTDLTISQWGCLGLLVIGIALMGMGLRYGTCLPPGKVSVTN